MAIRSGYRPLPHRTHPSRRRTEQKNPAGGAGADTKLPSQYGKLFQLNRGIQIEFLESLPAHHRDDQRGALRRVRQVYHS